MKINFRLKSCLLLVLLISGISFAEEASKPILCRTVECNTSGIEDENSKAMTFDSEKVVYIIAFKQADGTAAVTDKELLDEFNKNRPNGVKTHHFRYKQGKEGAVGRICVDGKGGKEAIVEMMAKNKNLVLVSAEPATKEQLKELGITTVPMSKPAAPRGSDKLSFVLKDALGREIRSEDYAGSPVLIMAGSCWCGGCQQDAEPLRKIAEQYMPKGLAVIRSVSGDNELAAIDFAKHYRLNFPQILDTNREFEMRYNKDGWTFLMMADGQGKVVFKCNNPVEEDWSAIRNLARAMIKTEDANQTTVVDGVRYMNKTLERSGEKETARQHDELTSIACAGDGTVYLVFTRNRNGDNDVLVRTYNGTQWSQDRPVASTKADEYDGTVIVDNNNQAWAAWTSNAEGGPAAPNGYAVAGKYNIFVTSISQAGEPNEPKRISLGEDDSMHGRLACDKDGNIWVTFSKWQNMGGISRDKEIFVRRLTNGQWSKQVQVSPTDVPDHEDHSEPVIAGSGNGAIVCWSWDFHQPEGYTKQAELPTIFVRKVDKDFQMSRAVFVSAKDTDVTPAVGIINGQTWCAWDSMRWDGRLKANRKYVCLAQADVTGQQNSGQFLAVSEPMTNVCSPSIAVNKDGKACVVWSQTEDGEKWILVKAEYDAGANKWKQADIVESQGNPRFCSACFDNKGKLWIAYSIQKGGKREIAVKQL